MMRSAHRRGMTLLELLLLIAVLSLLAGMLSPVLASASAAARRTSCTLHLRQIGKAYQMYLADYGVYPTPRALAGSLVRRDGRVLVCPEDDFSVPGGSASSYHFRRRVPPAFTPLSRLAELDAGTVLAYCDHHLGPRPVARKAEEVRLAAPEERFYLVLRAGGAVDRVHASRLRTFYLPGDRMTVMHAFPGDPGYAQAGR